MQSENSAQIEHGLAMKTEGEEQVQIIVDNEYGTLRYHSDKRIIHHSWHKSTYGAEFRAILNAGIETMRSNQATKWLSDNRNSMMLPAEDTEWAQNDWFPRAVEAGWKYWALVVPEDAMAKFNLMAFIDSYFEKGLRIMVFVTPDEALKWLVKFPKQVS